MAVKDGFQAFFNDYFWMLRAAVLCSMDADFGKSALLSHSQSAMASLLEMPGDVITIAKVADMFSDQPPVTVELSTPADPDAREVIEIPGTSGDGADTAFNVRYYFKLRDDLLNYPHHIRDCMAAVQAYFDEQLEELREAMPEADARAYKEQQLLPFYRHAGLEAGAKDAVEPVYYSGTTPLPPPLDEMTPHEALTAIRDYYIAEMGKAAEKMEALIKAHITGPEPGEALFPGFKEIQKMYRPDGTRQQGWVNDL